MSNDPPAGPGDTVMKWVTRVSAVIALGFAIIQVVRTVSDVRDRHRQIDELVRTAELQKHNLDYEHAWAGYAQAVTIAESGGVLAKLTGQLSTEAGVLRVLQENLAMAWLDNIEIGPGQTFSEVVDKVAPVLTRGAAMAGGRRKADLVAHLGWASYLLTREGRAGGDPALQYRDALAADPQNPYAHAYLGHWLEGTGRPVEEGRAEFAAALASGRATNYVRVLQLAAMRNRGSEGELDYVAIANDMRKNGEPFDATARTELFDIYAPVCGYREDAAGLGRLLTAAPAAEQAATVRALLVDRADIPADQRPEHNACVAVLLEAAGDRAQALDVWRTVRQQVPAHDPNGLAERAEQAIRRLGTKS